MNTFPVFCPCGCETIATATDRGFKATMVTITDTCFGVPVVERKSRAYALAVPQTVVSHRDGLVTFGAVG